MTSERRGVKVSLGKDRIHGCELEGSEQNSEATAKLVIKVEDW